MVLASDGTSRGYGFVRFGDKTDQGSALREMTGYLGLGANPIRVSMAVQKA